LLQSATWAAADYSFVVTKNNTTDPLAARVAERADALSPAEQRVAHYLRTHQEAIVLSTADQLGKLTGTSNATVIRTVKALGYVGLPQLKQVVGQRVFEHRTPGSVIRERLTSASTPAGIADAVLAESVDRLADTRRLLREEDLTAAVELIEAADAVLGYGIGLAELPVNYLTTRLRRQGKRARSTSATGYGMADELLAIGPGHLVVLCAPHRLLTDMRTLIRRAQRVGAKVLLVTDSLEPILGKDVDLSLSAQFSNFGLSFEGLASLFIMDCLLAGLAQRDPDRVSRNTELLADLRAELVPKDASAHRKRIPRGD
jgi:DNA-binding MurR/RpiR family transcriptional regulator